MTKDSKIKTRGTHQRKRQKSKLWSKPPQKLIYLDFLFVLHFLEYFLHDEFWPFILIYSCPHKSLDWLQIFPFAECLLFFLSRVRRRKTIIIRVFLLKNRRKEGKKQKEKKITMTAANKRNMKHHVITSGQREPASTHHVHWYLSPSSGLYIRASPHNCTVC